MKDDAKTIARRWFEEVWNDRHDDAVDELMAKDAYGHVEGGEVRGPDDFRKMREMFFSALPDVRIVIEDILAEGDRAAVRWRAEGTHGGEGFGFERTNEPVTVRGTTWLIVRDGKIVEGWDTWNLGALVQGLQAKSMARRPASSD